MFRNYSTYDLALVALCLEEEDKEYRRSFTGNSTKRRFWVHGAWKKRSREGEFSTLLPHLLDDESKFYEYFRMPMSTFNLLEMKLHEKLSKQDTHFRRAITTRQRLAVFLRYSLNIENTSSETDNAWFCSSKVCGDTITGQDCGDAVSSWLSLVLKKEGLRLIKLQERNSKETLSLSNQAQYLFINKASVDWLSDQLDNSTDCTKESMIYRFRSNFVLSGFEKAFEEQNWNKVTIGAQDFKVTGACGRCQMICIDQETGTKTLEPLTTLAASFKGKLKFGIYLSTISNKSSILNIGDPITFET